LVEESIFYNKNFEHLIDLFRLGLTNQLNLNMVSNKAVEVNYAFEQSLLFIGFFKPRFKVEN